MEQSKGACQPSGVGLSGERQFMSATFDTVAKVINETSDIPL